MSESFFQILSRVHTFKIGYWPYVDRKQLCPYRLSAYGYFLSKPYFMQCSICHHTVQIPKDIQASFESVCKEALNHKENCPYIGNEKQNLQQGQTLTSKEQIYIVMDAIMAQVKQGHHLLTEMKKFPVLNKSQLEQCFEEDRFTFKLIDQSLKLNWTKQIKISLFLEYFGWSIKKDLQNNQNLSAQCVLCGRNVSLSKVKMLDKDYQSKQVNFTEQESFSPVSSHRYFCLWVNPKCSGYTGYSIYTQHLYDKIIESKSLFSKRSPSQTRKIRVEMDKYLQNFQQKTSQQFLKIKAIFMQCEQSRMAIANEIQKQQKTFDNVQTKMKQFMEQVEEQIKQPVKKIKIN